MPFVMTIGDLRQLLANVDDDTALEVAATPDVNGWTQHILSCVHRDENKIVLALSGEAVNHEEYGTTMNPQPLVFRDSAGNIVRPC